MKGIRFYKEVTNKNRKAQQDLGTVVAVILGTDRVDGKMVVADVVGSVYERPNSPVCSTSVSWSYLRLCTIRISEEKAREIHPVLFEYLDR